MAHSALRSESVAVVTGSASGIGLAAAVNFASLGMRVVIADRDGNRLSQAADIVSNAGAADVMAAELDVAERAQLEALEKRIADRFGGTDILMNNAGVGGQSSTMGSPEPWERMLDVNLWGAVHGT